MPSTLGGDFRQIVNDNFGNGWILTPVNQTDYRMTLKQTEVLKIKADTITQTKATIANKVNQMGLTEASVQQRGGGANEAQLLVQLPGVDDPAHVKQILGTAAQLGLYEVKGGPFATPQEAMQAKGQKWCCRWIRKTDQGTARRGASRVSYGCWRGHLYSESRHSRFAALLSQDRGWETEFVLAQDAAKRFERFTGAHIHDQLAIVLDGVVLSAPVINGKISDNGVIEGMGSHDNAADLALELKAGSMPAGVEYLEERAVGAFAGLGFDQRGNVRRHLRA